MRIIKNNIILKSFYETGVTYHAPINLNFFWNFGIFSLIIFILQIITGIFLAMHYVPNTLLAFLSVEHIMRDVNYGWLIRYLHFNGASFFFLVVYIHIFRGLYYGSYVYPRQLLWVVGVLIFLLMIITAFLGYVLPWGQMSFWAATVITNLASAVPYIGIDIVQWIWGGFSVDNATLNRFFSLHYLLPFIILFLVIIHLILLHETHSSNELGIEFQKIDGINFFPYYILKDFIYIIILLILLFIFVCFYPNTLGHPDNYIKANPLQTPSHIVPEWYFLPFYAILRSIPNKLIGVFLLLFSIIILILIPFYITPKIRSNFFKPISAIFFHFFLLNFAILGWIGSKPLEYPYLEIGFYCTFFYFFYFLILLLLVEFFENFFIEKNRGYNNNDFYK